MAESIDFTTPDIDPVTCQNEEKCYFNQKQFLFTIIIITSSNRRLRECVRCCQFNIYIPIMLYIFYHAPNVKRSLWDQR